MTYFQQGLLVVNLAELEILIVDLMMNYNCVITPEDIFIDLTQ